LAEGGHDVGSLLAEHGRDPVDQLLERHVRHAAVGTAEPSNGTSGTPPSGQPNHSCRYGDLPTTRQALASSTRRTAPRVSGVAPLLSAIAPPSPSVACTKKNRNSGSARCSATTAATPYASSSGCATTAPSVRPTPAR
jgi:hypothetical protein